MSTDDHDGSDFESRRTLDRLLDALGEEWAYGVVRLTEFEKLFGKDEHIELLKDVGGAFFGDVQQILWDDLLLRITRLTDQADAGKGKDNLTVHRLQKFCERDELLLKKVKEQVEAADHAAKVARLHRDKRIGHKDLNYALAGIQPQPTTLKQIRAALDAVRTVLNTVNAWHRRPSISPQVSVDPRVDEFLGRTQCLIDAVLCIEELLADLSGQAPAWDDDVARDCIRRLAGAPSPENVRRIVNLRTTAGWLRQRPPAAST